MAVKKSVTEGAVDVTDLYKENESLKQQNEAIQAQMKQMQEMMEKIMSQQSQSTSFSAPVEQEVKEISMNSYIKVMSLYRGGMTLFTSKVGGKEYRFNEFGEIIPILYSDLVSIIANHRRFAKEGFFIILDNSVVEQSALSRDYKRILTKEAIDTILEKDNEELQDIYKGATDYHKSLIIETIAEKISKGEYVNRDKLQVLKEVSGKDIEIIAKAFEKGLSDMSEA